MDTVFEGLGADEPTQLATLSDLLSDWVAAPVHLQLTENRRTMLSTGRSSDRVDVRLHRMFLDADGPVIDAIGRYVSTGDRQASRLLGEFIEANRGRFKSRPAPRNLAPRGDCYDLREIFSYLERVEFPDDSFAGVEITWGKRGTARGGRHRKRSIRLGTYTREERLIRIHPVLDQAWVPQYFLQYIVFHEMLHHVEPARVFRGRTIFHTSEFQARERAFADFSDALEWERANLHRLLEG